MRGFETNMATVCRRAEGSGCRRELCQLVHAPRAVRQLCGGTARGLRVAMTLRGGCGKKQGLTGGGAPLSTSKVFREPWKRTRADKNEWTREAGARGQERSQKPRRLPSIRTPSAPAPTAVDALSLPTANRDAPSNHPDIPPTRKRYSSVKLELGMYYADAPPYTTWNKSTRTARRTVKREKRWRMTFKIVEKSISHTQDKSK